MRTAWLATLATLLLVTAPANGVLSPRVPRSYNQQSTTPTLSLHPTPTMYTRIHIHVLATRSSASSASSPEKPIPAAWAADAAPGTTAALSALTLYDVGGTPLPPPLAVPVPPAAAALFAPPPADAVVRGLFPGAASEAVFELELRNTSTLSAYSLATASAVASEPYDPTAWVVYAYAPDAGGWSVLSTVLAAAPPLARGTLYPGAPYTLAPGQPVVLPPAPVCTVGLCTNGGVCSLRSTPVVPLHGSPPALAGVALVDAVCSCPLGFGGATCASAIAPSNANCALTGCAAPGVCLPLPYRNTYACVGAPDTLPPLASVAPHLLFPNTTILTLNLAAPLPHTATRASVAAALSVSPLLPPSTVTPGRVALCASRLCIELELADAATALYTGSLALGSLATVQLGTSSVALPVATAAQLPCGLPPSAPLGAEYACTPTACHVMCPEYPRSMRAFDAPVTCNVASGSWSAVPACVPMEAPAVTSATPSGAILLSALPATLTFSGSGFGTKASDLLAATFGPNTCASLTWISSTSFSCSVPVLPTKFSHPLLIERVGAGWTNTEYYITGYNGMVLSTPATETDIENALITVNGNGDVTYDTLVIPVGDYSIATSLFFNIGAPAKDLTIIGAPDGIVEFHLPTLAASVRLNTPGLTLAHVRLRLVDNTNASPHPDGPIQLTAPNVVLSHVRAFQFDSNAYQQAAVVYVGPGAAGARIEHCKFEEVFSGNEGGLFYIDAPNVVVTALTASKIGVSNGGGGVAVATANADGLLFEKSYMEHIFGTAHPFDVADGIGITVASTYFFSFESHTVAGGIRLGETGPSKSHAVHGCIFEESRSGGAGTIRANAGNVAVYNTTFLLLEALASGGAISAVGSTSLTYKFDFYDNTYIGNVATIGGAVYFDWPTVSTSPAQPDSYVRISGSVYEANVASFGGAVAAGLGFPALTAINEHYFQNAAGVLGGAFFLSPRVGSNGMGDVTLENCRFIENFSIQNAGAFYADGLTRAAIVDSIFSGNTAMSQGGAFAATYADELKFDNVTFTTNRAGARGGSVSLFVVASALFEDSEVSNSLSLAAGGGVFMQETRTVVRRSVIFGNTAPGAGGGIFAGPISVLEVYDSECYSNDASSGGCVAAVNMRMEDSAVRNNSALFDGGGIWAIDPSDTSLLRIPTHADELLQRPRDDTLSISGVTVRRTDVRGNVAGRYGGGLGVGVRTGVSVVADDVAFVANTASAGGGFGGGLALAPSTTGMTCLRCSFAGENNAERGGAIYVSADSVLGLAGSGGTSVSGARAADGGCVYVAAGGEVAGTSTVTVSGCTAAKRGGGAYVLGTLKSSDKVVVRGCSSKEGGGVAVEVDGVVEGGTGVEVSKCTSTLAGGGVFAVGLPAPFIGGSSGVVVKDNVAVTAGGGGVFLCFTRCGHGVPAAHASDAGLVAFVAAMSLIGNSATFGRDAASSRVAIRWVAAPAQNATLGVDVATANGGVPTVEVVDVWGKRMVEVNREASDSVQVSIEYPTSELVMSGSVGHVLQDSGLAEIVGAFVAVAPALERPDVLGAAYTMRVTYGELSVTHVLDVLACQPGLFSTTLGSGLRACRPCATGSYSDGGIGAECVPCPTGRSGPSEGLGECVLCEAGTFSTVAGATRCAVCPGGEYSLTGAATCLACPEGGACEFGTLTPKAGWFSDVSSGSSSFHRCPNPDACVGGTCAPNYEGVLCDACVRHGADGAVYAKVGEKCSKCPDIVESWVLIALGVAGVGGVTLFFIVSASKAKSTVSIVFKIMLDFLQLISLSGELAAQASSKLTQFFNFTRTATTSVNVFPIRCVWEYEYYKVFAVYVMVPPIAVVVLGLVFLVVRGVERRRGVVYGWREYAGRLCSALAVVFFVAYPSVIKALFQVFACHEDLGVLKADVHTTCYDTKHKLFAAVGALALGVYCVGVPFGWVWWMRGVVEREGPRGGSLKRFMFVIDGFRDDVLWWEIVSVARKTGLVIVVVFLSDTVHTQSMFALVLLYAFAAVHLHIKPYAVAALNYVEGASLAVLLLNMLGSILFVADDGGRGEVREDVAIALIFVNLVFLGSVCVYGVVLVVRAWRGVARVGLMDGGGVDATDTVGKEERAVEMVMMAERGAGVYNSSDDTDTSPSLSPSQSRMP